jgi:hypothetical protein
LGIYDLDAQEAAVAADDFGVWGDLPCVGENRGLVGFYLYFLPLSLTEPELVFCPFFSYF